MGSTTMSRSMPSTSGAWTAAVANRLMSRCNGSGVPARTAKPQKPPVSKPS